MPPAKDILESKPTASPLYRCFVDNATSTTKYLIGYRAITLLPFADKVTDGTSTSNEPIPVDPVPDTVAIRLGETKGAGSEITDNIHIHAEDVYIYTGSYFSFRGKNLRITANRIFAVGHGPTSSSPRIIEFDCSGHQGKPYDTAAKNPEPGHDAPAKPDTPVTAAADLWSIQDGALGTNGAKGNPGEDGGTISIVGNLQSVDKKDCSLKLNVFGGLGGPGQDGSKGGDGGFTVGGSIWKERLIDHEDIDVTKVTIDRCRVIYKTGDSTGDAVRAFEEALDLDDSRFPLKAKDCVHRLPEWCFENPMYRGVFDPKRPTIKQKNLSIKAIIGAFTFDHARRFYSMPGQGGDGGDAGDKGSTGTVSISLITDEKFTALSPDPVSLVVSGGKGGAPGSGVVVSSPYLKECQQAYEGTNYNLETMGKPGDKDYNPGITFWPKRGTFPYQRPSWNGHKSEQAMAKYDLGQLKGRAAARDPVHLIMILQRLKFEYQMGYGAQLYSESDSTGEITGSRTSLNAQRFKDSIDWLRGCLKDYEEEIKAEDDEKGSTTNIYSQFQQAANKFLFNMAGMTDIYDNPIDLIVNPVVSLSDVKTEITSLRHLELLQSALSEGLNDFKAAAAQASQNVESLRDAKNASQKSKAQLIQNMEETYDEFQKLQRGVKSQRDTLSYELEEYWGKIKHNFDAKCTGWTGVLSSVGSVLMFAPGEGMSPNYALGGAFSIAASIGDALDSLDEAEKQRVKQDAIEKKIYRIEENIGGVDPEGLLKRFSMDDPSIADPNAADNLLSTILVEKKKFEALCDRYFDELDIESDDLQGMFDDFVDTVQSMRSSIRTYTTLVSNYLQAQKDWKVAEKSLELLAAANPELANPTLDLIYQFYVRSMSEQFAATLKTLYEGVRAYNCMALRRSDAFADMAELESFDNITSDIMEACLNKLHYEIIAFSASNFANPSTAHLNRTFSLTKESNSRVIDNFLTSRSLSFAVPPKDQHKVYGFPPGWYDVRLKSIRVYLIGAKSKRSRHGRSIIDVQVTLGTRFTVLDKQFKEHDFQFPSPGRTISLSYSFLEGKEDVMDENGDAPIYETNFQFSSTESAGLTAKNVPLASPFTKWQLSVDESVDVSGVTEVLVKMDVLARATGPGPVLGVLPPSLQRILARLSPFASHDTRFGKTFSDGLRMLFGSPKKIISANNQLNIEIHKFGKKTGDIVQKFLDKSPEGRAAREEWVQKANGIIENALHDNPGSTYRGWWYGGPAKGHKGGNGSIVEADPKVLAPLADNMALAAWAFFKSFPGRVLIFTPEASRLMAESEDIPTWLEDPKNAEHIKQAAQPHYDIGLDTIVMLTPNSFVKIKDIIKVEKDGEVVFSFQVVTTKLHPLDGMVFWNLKFVRSRPGEVMITHLHVGEHGLAFMDYFNASLGYELMSALHRAFPHVIEALALGVDPHKYLAEKDPVLWGYYSRFLCLDKIGGPLATTLRDLVGANSDANRDRGGEGGSGGGGGGGREAGGITMDMNEVILVTTAFLVTAAALASAVDGTFETPLPLKDAPVIKDENKLVENGVQLLIGEALIPVNLSSSFIAGDFNPPPDRPKEQQELLERTVKDVLRYTDFGEINTAISKATRPYIENVTEELKKEGSVPTEENVLNRLAGTPEYLEAGLTAFVTSALPKDVLAQIGDSVDAALPELAETMSATQIDNLVFEAAFEGTREMEPVVTTWIDAHIYDVVHTEVQKYDLNAILEEATKEFEEGERKIAELVRKKETLERDDPEIKRIDERLREIENEHEKTKEKLSDVEEAERLGKEDPAEKRKEFDERAKEEKKKWEEKDRHRDHPERPPHRV